MNAAHLFGAERVFEVGKPGAVEFVLVMIGWRQEQVPEAFLPRLRLQLLEDGNHLPTIGAEGLHLLVIGIYRRIDVFRHEGDDAVPPVALPLRKREIHR